ncbi:microcephalin isoform X2 [Cricetulus griseus]|nr:microcephalin isoform X2 [Cricetulus griseus]XP_027245453.1 microcephalin isoform X2 [Cricetulus griseus]
MGATVSKTLNKQVTHVIFKDGYQSTWDKARKTGAKLVSVLWVEKCRMAGAHVDESLFPAVNTDEELPSLIRKKHKCMQPKDFIPKTPENDKRLQKKFEKMAEELQRQKTTLDDGVPVLLFESPRSLVYSSMTPIRNHKSTMEKRLQEMREKRENLSPTSSQMFEQSQQNPNITPCEASLNIAHESSRSDESFASCSHSSFDGLLGNQERKLGRSVNEMTRMACSASPVLKISSSYSSLSPNHLCQPSPQKAKDRPPKEDISWQKDAAGEKAELEREQAAHVSQGMSDEKLCLSPATTGNIDAIDEPKSCSAKRKRPVDLGSPPKGKLKKKRYNRNSALSIQLFKSDHRPQFTTSPILGTPDVGASSYEDYFSPDNLKERNSEALPPEAQALSSPSLFHCRSLSKWERRSILEMCDFTSIGDKPRSISITDSVSRSTSSLEKPDKEEVSTVVETSAKDSPEHCRQPDPQLREDTALQGSTHANTHNSPAHCSMPSKGGSKEEREPVDVKGSPKDNTTPPALASSEGEAHSFNFGGDCNIEKSAEEKENKSTGYSESVKNGPVKPDTSGSSCTGLVRPQEKPKKCGKGQKPMRTLVMTSMPSEKQSLIIQVVNTLKGFSFTPEVCESTTHVLVGKSVRTLNVLMGIARGCWILSYEWVLWSLELGHWISEEPFELSESFPAAPICRLERQLSTQRYQGTLFANQPKMFIAPASSPPRAKLCELVLLCGGQVSPAPQQASLIIGPYCGKKEARIQYLSEKWVLDSITQHKVCDFNNYQLLQ